MQLGHGNSHHVLFDMETCVSICVHTNQLHYQCYTFVSHWDHQHPNCITNHMYVTGPVVCGYII